MGLKGHGAGTKAAPEEIEKMAEQSQFAHYDIKNKGEGFLGDLSVLGETRFCFPPPTTPKMKKQTQFRLLAGPGSRSPLIPLQHTLDVRLGLRVRRHAVILADRARPRVIRRQRQPCVPVVLDQQLP